MRSAVTGRDGVQVCGCCKLLPICRRAQRAGGGAKGGGEMRRRRRRGASRGFEHGPKLDQLQRQFQSFQTSRGLCRVAQASWQLREESTELQSYAEASRRVARSVKMAYNCLDEAGGYRDIA